MVHQPLLNQYQLVLPRGIERHLLLVDCFRSSLRTGTRKLAPEGCFWDEHAFRTSKQHFLDRATIRRLGKQWQ
jgi:hypothetical protein